MEVVLKEIVCDAAITKLASTAAAAPNLRLPDWDARIVQVPEPTIRTDLVNT